MHANDKSKKRDIEAHIKRIKNQIYHAAATLFSGIDDRFETKLDIYDNAFEWRIEFPQVLDEKGNFIGFDAVIGNPPYGATITKEEQNYFIEQYKSASYKLDTYALFMELMINISRQNRFIGFIVPYTWLSIQQHRKLREILLKQNIMQIIDLPTKIFEGADLDTVITIIQEGNSTKKISIGEIEDQNIKISKAIDTKP
ncbi:MAG: Eco57I restriction-modification methylase domain-containing protein, partial [Alphaproteobacteria bacterium]|nr:Eco57I restriction-modification methylase domain-containing protein [Alphaproteobacteria bacterium]